MIIFQVSLNFDPVKKILKIRCQTYALTKKVIILKKIQVTKTFAPPFFNHFSLSVNRKKKRVVMAASEKETKHIYA